jgi:hypothetical protein
MNKNNKKLANRTLNNQYIVFFRKSFQSVSEAYKSISLHEYHASISYLFDSIEYFWKAISILQSGNFPEKHMPSFLGFKRIQEFLENHEFVNHQEASQLQEIFFKHNSSWEANPKYRNFAKYDEGKIGQYETLEWFTEINNLLPSILIRIQRILLHYREMKIGILDGYFSLDKSHEHICTEYPWADAQAAGISGWKNHISFPINEIPISGLSPTYSVVINPFGEAYPEISSNPLTLPAFTKICDYIFSGGIFVTAGGQPFYYYFDVISGEKYETIKSIPNVPYSFHLFPENDITKLGITTVSLIPDTLAKRAFDINTTMGLNDEQKTPFETVLFQEPIDKEKYTLLQTVEKYKVFRALLPKEKLDVIPICRANLGTELCYPVALIKYGQGYLLHFGFSLKEPAEKEFSVITEIVEKMVIKDFLINFING